MQMSYTRVKPQQGFSLVVALIFLLVLTVLGVAGMRGTVMEEKMAGNLRNRNLAFQTAEAALREGEDLVQTTSAAYDGNNGLYQFAAPGTTPVWESVVWGNDSEVVVYGQSSTYIAAPPRYVIEELPAIRPEGSLDPGIPLPDPNYYRITSRAVGGTATTVVILQSIYKL